MQEVERAQKPADPDQLLAGQQEEKDRSCAQSS
jgi:hypothetical protein